MSEGFCQSHNINRCAICDPNEKYGVAKIAPHHPEAEPRGERGMSCFRCSVCGTERCPTHAMFIPPDERALDEKDAGNTVLMQGIVAKDARIAELEAALSEEREKAGRLVEAAEGYVGNGCDPTDGDIVHVPQHCRQCRLINALKLYQEQKEKNQ